jgi:hypothetical protein
MLENYKPSLGVALPYAEAPIKKYRHLTSGPGRWYFQHFHLKSE